MLSPEDLAQIALQHAAGAVPVAQPNRAGADEEAGEGAESAEEGAEWMGEEAKEEAKEAEQRGKKTNWASPMHSAEKRAKVAGAGKWKVWTAEAILRAAFFQPSAALCQVAEENEGASASQVSHARSFVARTLLREQERGLRQQQGRARHLVLSGDAQPPQVWILNLMFDETELECKLGGEGPSA